MESYAPFLAGLVALLVGLAAGKAWERYKLQEGRWIDRRRARESPHYILGPELDGRRTSSIAPSTNWPRRRASSPTPSRSR